MSHYNNNNQEMVAVLEWNALRTSKKTTAYSPGDLEYMRKPAPISGTGYVYYNPHRDTYEKPRSITVIPKSKIEALQTRSASLGSKVSDNDSVLPANLRLHEVFNSGTTTVVGRRVVSVQ